MQDLNILMREVHKNAVDHGWWAEGRNDDQTLDLIHSEWSEALEEERLGHPMVWKDCHYDLDEVGICTPNFCRDHVAYPDTDNCKWKGKKPEGFAVELIDGCIRILDYMGYVAQGEPAFRPHVDTIDKLCSDEVVNKLIGEWIEPLDDIFTLVRTLHALTAMVSPDEGLVPLVKCLMICFNWIKRRGLDPEQILMDKHEYNKTRPYKHGKKF